MSAGNRPLPGISAIPGINKIPGFEGQPFGMGSMGSMGAFGGAIPSMPGPRQTIDGAGIQSNPVATALGGQSAPGAIPAGMQLVNGALERKPQQAAQSPFGSPFAGIHRRLWG
jgi:hypothetical protein